MAQNLNKNTSGAVTSCYQSIPIITEIFTNSTFSLVIIGYLKCLFKYTSRCWGVFDWSDFLKMLEMNQNVSKKLGSELHVTENTLDIFSF